MNTTREPGTIIILNGVSSSGKTTFTRALQEYLKEPYFWIGNDTFCDMYPSILWQRDWVSALHHSLTAMIYTIRTFSDLGYNCIVDQVFLNTDTEGDLLPLCVQVLDGYPVVFVRVNCSIAELERRELQRGDRTIGQARSQLPLIKAYRIYDCEIDTSANSPEENIAIVKNVLKHPTGNTAFQQLKQQLDRTGSLVTLEG
jgi:chloramphenicol 3-O phosphotransferase